MRAIALISQLVGGARATTCPKITTNTVCMVNGISDHSPSPKAIATARGVAPATIEAVLTSAGASTAKLNVSGNQRSIHAVVASAAVSSISALVDALACAGANGTAGIMVKAVRSGRT